jgi:hypothetical protein
MAEAGASITYLEKFVDSTSLVDAMHASRVSKI